MATTYRFYRIHTLQGVEEYIGSTRQRLAKRWSDHVSSYKKGLNTCNSRLLFDKYGVDNCLITLIDEKELPTIEHALREERRILEERKEYAVNRCRPIVFEEDRKQDRKIQYIAHREEMAQFYQDNREEIKERCLKYYHANKERIIPKLHRVVQCPHCQKSLKYMSLSSHKKRCVTPS